MAARTACTMALVTTSAAAARISFKRAGRLSGWRNGTSPATPVVTGTSSRAPVASAKNVSPSVSPWAGRTARARPS